MCIFLIPIKIEIDRDAKEWKFVPVYRGVVFMFYQFRFNVLLDLIQYFLGYYPTCTLIYKKKRNRIENVIRKSH